MPRYYFHFVLTADRIPDPDGVLLQDLRAAHRHALRLLWQTASFVHDENMHRWRVLVTDESQSVVLAVLFPAQVVKGEFGRREPAKHDCNSREGDAKPIYVFEPPRGEGHRL